ncbi:MAG: DUF4089 domain-containing protein [Burkholderiales bacterium]
MNEQELARYVDAACAAQGIALREDERERVIGHFGRIAAIAAPVLDVRLPDDVEIAPVFEP